MIKEFPWESIRFPTHKDARGSLTMAQTGERGLVPFEVKRAYWLHDTAGPEAERGAHATFGGNQLMIPVIGGCDLLLNDGVSWRDFNLAHSPELDYVHGVWVKSGAWRELRGFGKDTVILILSDTLYEDVDYVRNWPDFLDRVGKGQR